MTDQRETLKEAVEGVPEASWTDDQGQIWTAHDILSQWPAEKLNQPVDWGEDEEGNPEIRTQGKDGTPVLTMTPQAGWGLTEPQPPGLNQ